MNSGSANLDPLRPDATPDAIEAYRFFLGRKPDPAHPPQYGNIHDLNRMLERSVEFRNSHRALKAPLGWPLAQVFISKSARVLYCPIGKNACTFLKSEVARASGLPQMPYMLRDIHFLTDHVRTGLQLSDYTEDQVARLIVAKQYFKFAVLRDPTDRLLSAYIEKFVIGRLEPANIHHTKSVVDPVQAAAKISPPNYDLGITFRQFVQFIGSADITTLDPHWRSQASYLQGITYDRLFRIDQLDELIDILEERSATSLERKARNVTRSGRGTAKSGSADFYPADIAKAPRILRDSFFDYEIQTIVENVFASDYALIEQTRGFNS